VLGDIGPNFVQKITFDRILGVNAVGTPPVSVNTGVKGTVGVGYTFHPQLAAEVETGFSYNETKASSAIVGGVPLNGSMQLWFVPLTVGVVWRPPIPVPPPPGDLETPYFGQKLIQKTRPYLGGGIGAAEVFGDIDVPAPSTNPTAKGGSGRDTVLTYYVKAGLMFPVTDNAELGFQYRFHGTPGFTIKDTKAQDVFAHAVSVALRISF
jgi:hypothetical protein